MTPDNSPDEQPVAYLRDLDGTGSLHACSKGDLGAIAVYDHASPVNQPDTLEEMLAALPDGWKLASIVVRRDRGWCYGGQLTYDALLEGGNDYEARGTGPTPRAALASALAKIEEV